MHLTQHKAETSKSTRPPTAWQTPHQTPNESGGEFCQDPPIPDVAEAESEFCPVTPFNPKAPFRVKCSVPTSMPVLKGVLCGRLLADWLMAACLPGCWLACCWLAVPAGRIHSNSSFAGAGRIHSNSWPNTFEFWPNTFEFPDFWLWPNTLEYFFLAASVWRGRNDYFS